jgi:DMSO/TMAO reductase YedYZ molybdopterin-dependent catalytic subunit
MQTPDLPQKTLSDKQVRNCTLIAFLVFIIGSTAAIAGWQWLHRQPKVDGTYQPLRRTLKTNEQIFKPLVQQNHLVKTYPVAAADKNVRFNGKDGLRTPLDSNWRLVVIKAPGDTLRLTLNQIRILPKTEIVYDFKCIEGWSQVTHWGGVKLKTFMDHYGLTGQEKMAYVGMKTPDGQYYVGIDMPSALHPQTLLAYEVNDKPLPMKDGYPLRLIIPVKYGIKHIKRIGSMWFSNQPPPDFWAERGYDYFAGL